MKHPGRAHGETDRSRYKCHSRIEDLAFLDRFQSASLRCVVQLCSFVGWAIIESAKQIKVIPEGSPEAR